jgi:hypothetical protein
METVNDTLRAGCVATPPLSAVSLSMSLTSVRSGRPFEIALRYRKVAPTLATPETESRLRK